MRTVEYRGTLLAMSSLTNSGQDSGTTHLFRRESMIRPDGEFIPAIPVMSGSVIRGSLRRTAAAMTQQALSQDGRLPLSVVHAMRTGGALRETKTSGEVLTGEKQALIRDLIPMFGVFGLSAGGRIMSGRLMVDKAVPVAEETMHLLEHYDLGGSLPEGYAPPSIWQLLQREQYTRFADVNDASASMAVESAAEIAQAIPKGSGTMIWAQEVLIPGTRLYHSLVLEAVTPLEADFFADLVATWSRNARIGGQRARGMGRVECSYERSVTDLLGVPADDEPFEGGTWRKVMAERSEEISEALAWLT